jgi:predicted HAD superfamily phosphohydrolase YqeG
MWHRVRASVVVDVAEVARRARREAGPLTVIFDADNTIVPQRVAPDEFVAIVNRTIDEFEAIDSVHRAIVLSNGPPRGLDRVINRGNKPWTSRRRLGVDPARERIWVVGDQILTDGLLAWRLGAEFFHCAIQQTGEHTGQAVMRHVGRVVGRCFLAASD